MVSKLWHTHTPHVYMHARLTAAMLGNGCGYRVTFIKMIAHFTGLLKYICIHTHTGPFMQSKSPYLVYSTETMLQSEVVGACSHGSIPEWQVRGSFGG